MVYVSIEIPKKEERSIAGKNGVEVSREWKLQRNEEGILGLVDACDNDGLVGDRSDDKRFKAESF